MVITGSRKDPFLKYDRVKWIDPLLPCFFFPYCISSLPLLRASIKPGHLSFPSLDALLVESEDPKYRRKGEINIRRKRKQEKRTYLFPFLFFSFLFFQEISVDRRDEGIRSVRTSCSWHAFHAGAAFHRILCPVHGDTVYWLRGGLCAADWFAAAAHNPAFRVYSVLVGRCYRVPYPRDSFRILGPCHAPDPTRYNRRIKTPCRSRPVCGT